MIQPNKVHFVSFQTEAITAQQISPSASGHEQRRTRHRPQDHVTTIYSRCNTTANQRDEINYKRPQLSGKTFSEYMSEFDRSLEQELNNQPRFLVNDSAVVPKEKDTRLDLSDIFSQIAKMVPLKNWRHFGRGLKIFDSKDMEAGLKDIQSKHSESIPDRIYEILEIWKKVNGEKATLESLLLALSSCDFQDIADKIRGSR